MRLYHLEEGRAHTFSLSYGSGTEDVLVIENPTAEQARTLLTRARQPDDSFYLRGLCVKNKKLLVWDGWKATHDDVRAQFFPKIASHNTELTTFEISNRDGFQVIRQGDYDVRATRWYANLMAAMAPINESVMMLDVLSVTVKVIAKPTVEQIIAMMTACQRIRGLADGTTLYLWDGYEAAHFQIAAVLGLERPIEFQITNYDNDPRVVIYDRERVAELEACPTFKRWAAKVEPLIMR